MNFGAAHTYQTFVDAAQHLSELSSYPVLTSRASAIGYKISKVCVCVCVCVWARARVCVCVCQRMYTPWPAIPFVKLVRLIYTAHL